MKTIIRTLILLLGLSLFACTPKERPVPPGNGENPVYISNPRNPGEICAVYMNGSTQYTILSHENTILRDSLSKSIAVGKAEMTTSAGTVVHYLSYDKWGSYHGEKGKRPVRILYADLNSSCVAWNEKGTQKRQRRYTCVRSVGERLLLLAGP